MALQINFDKKQKQFRVRDQSTKDISRTSFFGKITGDIMVLEPEEALYLIDVRKAKCTDYETDQEFSFNEVASAFSTNKKFMARYFTYKDWRDRGLIIKSPDEVVKDTGKSQQQ